MVCTQFQVVMYSMRLVHNNCLAMDDCLADIQVETQIYVCDINPNMLNVRKKRVVKRHVGLGENHSIIWVKGDAEGLSFEDGSMDGYTIAFGIKNVALIEKVLMEAYRHVGLGENRSIIWVEGDAEGLSFEDGSMDGYTIAFGIKNIISACMEQVKVSKGSPLVTCLLEGPGGSGKSAKAAKIGIDSDFAYVKIESGKDSCGQTF